MEYPFDEDLWLWLSLKWLAKTKLFVSSEQRPPTFKKVHFPSNSRTIQVFT
jgi:hypothetical protein